MTFVLCYSDKVVSPASLGIEVRSEGFKVRSEAV
jgi:hypothetical protein